VKVLSSPKKGYVVACYNGVSRDEKDAVFLHLVFALGLLAHFLFLSLSLLYRLLLLYLSILYYNNNNNHNNNHNNNTNNTGIFGNVHCDIYHVVLLHRVRLAVRLVSGQ
jgi:hypothetical protein